jgi:hypothetical protein
MNNFGVSKLIRPAATMSALVLLSATLLGCATSEERRQANLYRDVNTCEDFGARYGSPEHTQCMLIQQQRRDGQAMENLKKARLSQELAENAKEMYERDRDR